MTSYFVAVPLPDDVKDRLVALQPSPTATMRLIGREEFHLTLHFIGEILPTDIDAVRTALATIDVPAFTVAFQGIGQFPPEGPAKVLWAGVAANADLAELHCSLGAALTEAIDFRPEERPYSPHVTLARINEPLSPEIIERYLGENKEFAIAAVRLDWFALYSSGFADGVPQYRQEAVFPLSDSLSVPLVSGGALASSDQGLDQVFPP